jgi:hypothetical protein
MVFFSSGWIQACVIVTCVRLSVNTDMCECMHQCSRACADGLHTNGCIDGFTDIQENTCKQARMLIPLHRSQCP